MTKEDLRQLFVKIENDAWAQRKAAIKSFCMINNPYKESDIFEDHMGKIIIKEISIHYDGVHSCCIYGGPELKKDGTPKKNGAFRKAYQCNDIKRPN